MKKEALRFWIMGYGFNRKQKLKKRK